MYSEKPEAVAAQEDLQAGRSLVSADLDDSLESSVIKERNDRRGENLWSDMPSASVYNYSLLIQFIPQESSQRETYQCKQPSDLCSFSNPPLT
jgi:hypothetical protein